MPFVTGESCIYRDVERGWPERGETCDDNELREDKENICKEAETRQVGQARQEKGEKGDGEDQKRAEVPSHLPIRCVIFCKEVLEG